MFLPGPQGRVIRHANWYMPAEITHRIVAEIAENATFATIVPLSQVNSLFTASCQTIVRGRIRFALSRFMEVQDFEVFFDVLESTQALVAGSVALSVINPSGFSEHPPINLDIMTPCNTLPAWAKWAKARRAIQKSIDKPRFNKRDSTKCVLIFSILNVSVIPLSNRFSHLLEGISYQILREPILFGIVPAGLFRPHFPDECHFTFSRILLLSWTNCPWHVNPRHLSSCRRGNTTARKSFHRVQ